MSTRAIRTSTPQTVCDVCGRTLLRGERAEIYVAGGDRRSVCELCTARALHGGWVREGTIPDRDPARERSDRRRPWLRTRRARRRPVGSELESAPPSWDEELFGGPGDDLGDGEDLPISDAPEAELALSPDPVAPDDPAELAPAPDWPEPPPPSRGSRRRRSGRAPALRGRAARGIDREPGGGAREPRHVRAVPTSVEHKIDAAIELFNGSEHPRTVAGIARSLGLPDVAVHPTSPVGAIVDLVVSWELCWYRYEVDLSAEVPTVRGAGQGYELSELTPVERDANAVSDDHGRLTVR